MLNIPFEGLTVAADIPFDPVYFFSLLTNGMIWDAARTTILLAVAVWVSSVIAGLPIAILLGSRFRSVRMLVGTYVWVFRALPPLLLVIFTYAALPLLIPPLEGFLSSPFAAGYVALLVADAAFMAEVFRGSLLGVENGQREAARAIGLSNYRLYRHVIVPQALRIALPAIGNMFIGTLKGTSLVSVISLVELTLEAQRIYSRNFRVLEALTAVAIIYLLFATVYILMQRALERRLDVTRLQTRASLAPVDGLGAELAIGSDVKVERSLSVDDDELTPPGELDVARGGSLVASAVRKSFGAVEVLHGVDVTVSAGEVVVLIGPSGSGKTTLLRCMAGLETLDGGAITIDGHGVTATTASIRQPDGSRPRGVQIGLVFQRFNLFSNMTALGNVALGPRVVLGLSREAAEARARQLLGSLGLASHAAHYPHQLSGGQQQRVAIARALAMRPEVLLFDEPTSALDPELVQEVVGVVEGLAAQGLSMVIVSHEMRFVRRVASRIVVMDSGSVVDSSDPETLLNKARNDRAGTFISRLL